jgi:hypothetical protein
MDSLASLSGTLIVAHRSTPAQSSDDFNQVLLRLVSMLELVLLGLVPTTHFGKQLHRAELVRKFNLAAFGIVGLRQSVLGGYFSDGSFRRGV